jgi:hypothetical protein
VRGDLLAEQPDALLPRLTRQVSQAIRQAEPATLSAENEMLGKAVGLVDSGRPVGSAHLSPFVARLPPLSLEARVAVLV